jgi:hypothetical protein
MPLKQLKNVALTGRGTAEVPVLRLRQAFWFVAVGVVFIQ